MLMSMNSPQRLPLDTWVNIFRNLKDMTPEEYYDGVVDWVEVIWLDSTDGTDEWVLAFGEELFEDGFASEREAQERLNCLEKTLL
jgi:hypothetical protein